MIVLIIITSLEREYHTNRVAIVVLVVFVYHHGIKKLRGGKVCGSA